MPKRRFPVKDNPAVTELESRCSKSDGRRWRCPLPAVRKTALCDHHLSASRREKRDSLKKIPSNSEPQNPSPITDAVPDPGPHPHPHPHPHPQTKENGVDSELRELAQETPVPESEPGLDPRLESEENRDDSELREPDRSSVPPVREENEADSELRELDRRSEPPVWEENGVDSELRELDGSSNLEADLDPEELDQPLNRLKRKRKKEKREKEGEAISEELIRMAVKRQMERREKKEEKRRRAREKRVEVKRRELPNGVMEITSLDPARVSGNVGPIVDKNLGSSEAGEFRRRFRSKNVEPELVGVVKKFPSVLGKGKKRKKICGRSQEEKGEGCENKGCQTWLTTGAVDSELENIANDQNGFAGIKYALHQLQPVLKQFNWEQIFELEIEANQQGKRLAGVQLQVIECSPNEQFKCNYCRIVIVDLHRSCSKCNYKLCLSCSQEIRGESIPEGVEILTCEQVCKNSGEINKKFLSKCHSSVAPEREDANQIGGVEILTSKKVCKSSGEIKSKSLSECHSLVAPEREDAHKNDHIPCPPHGLGGCGDGVLSMKFLSPAGWTQTPDSTDLEGVLNTAS